mmetsp:Transcript_13584/g.48271  ORF Transcript_13584/g.48271 Transcript_13584/m.48271 type:complete len:676 (-) Transcript_13584:69-2096(-)
MTSEEHPEDRGPAEASAEPAAEPRAGPAHREWNKHTSWFRDAATWEWLEAHALFRAAARAHAERRSIRVWSCGASSGEELLSLLLLYEQRVAPKLAAALGTAPKLECFGTDRSAAIVEFAKSRGRCWTATDVATVPADVAKQHFRAEKGDRPLGPANAPFSAHAPPAKGKAKKAWRLLEEDRLVSACRFAVEDLTAVEVDADGGDFFDLVLCRYSVFLYSGDAGARRALKRIVARIAPFGTLVLGETCRLPQGTAQALQLSTASQDCSAFRLGDAEVLLEGNDAPSTRNPEKLLRAPTLAAFCEMARLMPPKSWTPQGGDSLQQRYSVGDRSREILREAHAAALLRPAPRPPPADEALNYFAGPGPRQLTSDETKEFFTRMDAHEADKVDRMKALRRALKPKKPKKSPSGRPKLRRRKGARTGRPPDSDGAPVGPEQTAEPPAPRVDADSPPPRVGAAARPATAEGHISSESLPARAAPTARRVVPPTRTAPSRPEGPLFVAARDGWSVTVHDLAVPPPAEAHALALASRGRKRLMIARLNAHRLRQTNWPSSSDLFADDAPTRAATAVGRFGASAARAEAPTAREVLEEYISTGPRHVVEEFISTRRRPASASAADRRRSDAGAERRPDVREYISTTVVGAALNIRKYVATTVFLPPDLPSGIVLRHHRIRYSD